MTPAPSLVLAVLIPRQLIEASQPASGPATVTAA
jgi:hypothetical protein